MYFFKWIMPLKTRKIKTPIIKQQKLKRIKYEVSSRTLETELEFRCHEHESSKETVVLRR